MKKLGLAIVAVISCGIALYAAYNLANPWHEHRFRLTGALEIDGAVVSKSEVYDIRWANSPYLDYGTLGFRGQRREMRGEALYFDTGVNTSVVVTMGGELNNPAGPNHVIGLAEEILRVDWDSPVLQESMSKGRPMAVPPKILPLTVVFDDSRDPETMRIVATDQEIPVKTGQKVRIQEAWLEMTMDYPGEFTLETELPWLKAYAERRMIREFVYYQTFGRRRDFIAKEFIDAFH